MIITAESPKRIETCYAEFLSTLPFTHYGTFTTSYSMSLPSARRMMERLHKYVSKAGECHFFWVAEKFDLKDGYHTHGLIQVPESLSYSNIRHLWQKVSGGINSQQQHRIDLQRYDRKRGANYYVGKYIKRKDTDYDIYL